MDLKAIKVTEETKSQGEVRRHRQLRERRRELGLCIRCKEPRVEGIQLCVKHRERLNAQSNANFHKYIKKRHEYKVKYHREHAEERIKKAKEYYEANKEKVREYKRSIRPIENARKRSPQARQKTNANRRAKKQSDPAWAMADRLRKRIGRAIRDYAPGRKLRKTNEYLGCSMDEFMAHIQSLFLPGMNWTNRDEWHIDHIKPCALFDLMDPRQQKQCFHYTNLQPLWAQDNIRKHAKWDESYASINI